jgi:hypothetical protein
MRQLVLAMSCALVLGCGPASPSTSLTGNWYFTFGKSRVYEMSLTQTGNHISGVVCSYALNPVFPARESMVTGEYPNVRFADPGNGSCFYNAKYEKDRDEIAGDCGSASLVRFSRGGGGRCAGAAPAPAR